FSRWRNSARCCATRNGPPGEACPEVLHGYRSTCVCELLASSSIHAAFRVVSATISRTAIRLEAARRGTGCYPLRGNDDEPDGLPHRRVRYAPQHARDSAAGTIYPGGELAGSNQRTHETAPASLRAHGTI